jgi:ankyrin repeat protein
MHRKLTAKSSLDTLRKEAKRWLQAIRANDAQALERLRRSYPEVSSSPVLRDIQHALAREHGVANWVALKALLVDNAMAQRSHQQRVAEFLEHSCLHYGTRPGTNTWDPAYSDDPSRWRYAARILERHPDILRDNIHAAAVSGDLAEVQRILALRPGAAMEKAGPQQFEPLLYVCYGRLPLPAAADNALAIANALLDAGADPVGHLGKPDSLFHCLTGAIGGGEFAQPPHPHAVALAEVLIDRGADPYDPQTMYDTALAGDDTFWLDFLYDRSARRNEMHKWRDPSSTWPERGILTYLLSLDVSRNRMQRAVWLLDRGADATSDHYYSKRSLHTEAMLGGFSEMAALLERFGAKPAALTDRDAFQAACMRLDRETANKLAQENPQFLRDPEPLLHAAQRDLLEVATFLLDLGVSPDVANQENYRPLHAAASSGAVHVGQLLIDRGAQIDPREKRHNGIPLGWALVGRQQKMLELLGRLSRDAKELTYSGNVERLRELATADPHFLDLDEASLLFYLPEDEEQAVRVAEFLLESGVDPRVKNKEGLTAAESADKRGLDAVADLLSS